MRGRILLVDDEPRLLAAARRHLGREFDLETATGPKEALQLLGENGPFAVIVTDMSMPGMSGVEMLNAAAKISPDTVNIMLTGNADIEIATNAFNEGTLFRYFTKPCDPKTLGQGMRAALRQQQLVSAEKQLLTQTLSGTIKMLTSILESLDPVAFQKTGRIRGWLKELNGHVDLPKTWAVDMAAMLAPIGNFTLPPALLAKLRSGETLTPDQQEALGNAPLAACELLASIPRMDDVTHIISHIATPYQSLANHPISENRVVFAGSRLLHILYDLADQLLLGRTMDEALLEMSTQKNNYDSALLSKITPILLLRRARRQSGEFPGMLKLKLVELQVGDVLRCNLVYKDTGRLILAEGHEVSAMGLARILADSSRAQILEPVMVERCQP